MRGLLLVLLMSLAAAAAAAPKVSVVGLFAGKAVVTVEGARYVLSEGEATPQGVRLVSADSRAAVLEIAGRRHRVGLSRSVGGSYAAPARRTVQIARNGAGMFTTAGSINGQPVGFLVDTGASSVAMNAAQALRLGIDYRVVGTRMTVNTASGVASAYRVMLDRVTVGGITVENVAAAVVDGPAPAVPLLGMSFLGRVKMRHEGTLLVLEEAF